MSMLNSTSEANDIKESKLKHGNKKPILNDNKCADCNKVFNFQHDLVRHVKQYHPSGKAFICSECGARFSNTQALTCHRRRVVNNLKQEHVCNFCSKSFIWKSHLLRHLSVHDEERPYACSYCNEKFDNKRKANHHEKVCTKPTTRAENLHNCKFCEKTYKYKRGLHRHLLTHSGERPYFCSLCEQNFKQKDEFKKHQQIHLTCATNVCNNDSLEKPHICKYCLKTFDFESLLKYHLRVHTGERPYSCPECTRTYIRQKDLNKHLKKGHHQQKLSKEDLTCKYCFKIFDRKLRLEQHLRAHIRKNSYSCYFCEAGFTRKHDFDRHLRKHMEEESKEYDRNTKIYKDACNISKTQEIKVMEIKDLPKSKHKTKYNLNNLCSQTTTDIAKTNIVCEFCSTSFKRSLQLKIHLKEHIEEKSIFNNHPEVVRQNLNKDRKSLHIREKLFPCSLFENIFKDDGNINQHKSHENDTETILKQMGKSSGSVQNTSSSQNLKIRQNECLSNDSEREEQELICNDKSLQNDCDSHDQLLQEQHINQEEISLVSNNLEVEDPLDTNESYITPDLVNLSKSSNFLATDIQPDDQSRKKSNIEDRQTKVAFKPQLFRGLNRCFKVLATGEQRNYPCCLCDKSYTEIRLLKDHQKIHLKQKSKHLIKSSRLSQPVKHTSNSEGSKNTDKINALTTLNIKKESSSDLDYRCDNMVSNNVITTIKSENLGNKSLVNSTIQLDDVQQKISINSNVNSDLQCQFCYILFSNIEFLKNHIKVHFDERLY